MIRAKFRCDEVQEMFNDKWDQEKKCYTGEKVKYAENVRFNAVYSSDKEDPNYSWSQATPCGQVFMSISNPGAWGAFKVNEQYFLDYTPAPKPVAP